MLFFASDLDNTMIYSYNHDIGKDKVLVETKDKKELSYMTEKSYFELNHLSPSITFIPVTTRSLEQYNRIDFGFIPKYAVVSNGGILLKNGVSDLEWHKKSIEIISESLNKLEKGIKLLSNDEHTIFEVRLVDELFVFTKSDDVNHSLNLLKNALDTDVCDIKNIGSKVYIIPKKLNKGNAIKRLREYLSAQYIICAGDSEFDIPMLKESDFALLPNVIKENETFKNAEYFTSFDNSIFSDWIFDKLKNFISK